MKYILLLTLVFYLNDVSLSQTHVDYYNQGMEAYKKGNYARFLKAAQKADSLRPNHPVLLHNLASAYALNGQENQALNTLEYRTRFYAAKDFLKDKDFKSLHPLPGWKDLKKQVEEYNSQKQRSSLAFQFDFAGFHPEGIVFSPETSRFLISDIRNGLIYSFDKNGANKRLEIDLKQHGFWSAMGIALNPNNPEILWVTTSALPNFSGYDEQLEGKSAVLCFDLYTGELLQSFSTDGKHIFGDLTISDNGTIYITDSQQPIVYQILNDSTSLTELVRHDGWWNLQGLALSDDKQTLYVADYITGIFQINLESKEINPLIKENERLRGADGIYLNNNRLILLQNGTQPKRVASIQLNESGYGIVETLYFPDNGLPELNEPTLGIWVNSDLYYIANSPWSQYDQEQNPDLDSWPALKVFKLPVD